jgi:hypothetical protein
VSSIPSELAGTTPAAAQPLDLDQSDFLPLSLHGWGDAWNAYVHSMTWFKDRLFCGTFRANICLKRRQKVAPPQWPVWPIRCPEKLFRDLDLRAQIWSYDPRAAQWDNVLRSPMVPARDEGTIPREIAYRGMAVFQGRSDPEPALYVSTFATTRSPGPVILRSTDGVNFEQTTRYGLGIEGVSSFRFLVPFRGRLYTSPVGSTQNVANQSTFPVVLESEDPASGEWRPVSEPGFGNPDNTVIFNVAPLGDHLYASAFNHVTGFEIWRTDADGPAPYRWEKVLTSGAYRGPLNQGVGAFMAFGDALYLGTGIQDGGYDRVNKVGPAAGEIIRLYPDGSWDLLVGSARVTPRGVKVPLSRYGPGFNDLFNGYMWRMCEHRGRLYVGTASWSVYLRYVDMQNWPKRFRDLVEILGIEETIAREGGFDLWSTADGINWTPVSTSGFGNTYNIGARSLMSTPYGLAVGTVNPFGPEVAVRRDGEWRYELNPRGGCEVWLGDPQLPDIIQHTPPQGSEPSGGRPASEYRLPAPEVSRRKRVDANAPAPDPARFVLDEQALTDLAGRIDVAAVAPDYAERAYSFYDMQVEGEENLPRKGRALLVGNNPSAPIFAGTTLVPEHTLFTLNAILKKSGRAARFLAPLDYYDSPERTRLSRDTVERLGFVPQAPGNGQRLLAAGEAVLYYPETRPSRPPYELRPFACEFVEMAWHAQAPIVPIVFLGPHEAHLMVEHDDHQIRINLKTAIQVQYLLSFLPALQPREHIADIDDGEQVRAFCEHVREVLQQALKTRMADRPVAKMARTLQRMYGTRADAPEQAPKGDV